jgi:hypothetical protein
MSCFEQAESRLLLPKSLVVVATPPESAHTLEGFRDAYNETKSILKIVDLDPNTKLYIAYNPQLQYLSKHGFVRFHDQPPPGPCTDALKTLHDQITEKCTCLCHGDPKNVEDPNNSLRRTIADLVEGMIENNDDYANVCVWIQRKNSVRAIAIGLNTYIHAVCGVNNRRCCPYVQYGAKLCTFVLMRTWNELAGKGTPDSVVPYWLDELSSARGVYEKWGFVKYVRKPTDPEDSEEEAMMKMTYETDKSTNDALDRVISSTISDMKKCTHRERSRSPRLREATAQLKSLRF